MRFNLIREERVAIPLLAFFVHIAFAEAFVPADDVVEAFVSEAFVSEVFVHIAFTAKASELDAVAFAVGDVSTCFVSFAPTSLAKGLVKDCAQGGGSVRI